MIAEIDKNRLKEKIVHRYNPPSDSLVFAVHDAFETGYKRGVADGIESEREKITKNLLEGGK